MSGGQSSVLEQLAAGQLLHIGILVPDLRAGLERYSGLLGLGPWIGYRFTPDNVADFSYRGSPARYCVEFAISDGSPQVELLQVHGEPSVYHEWIGRHGYGLHHLGVRVADCGLVTAEMAAAGYPVLQSGRGYGAAGDGAFAYYDTAADLGCIVEAIEAPRVRRPPDFVWPPGG